VTAAKVMLTAALGNAPVESRAIECATKSAPSVNGSTMGCKCKNMRAGEQIQG
jgi:hypothetical protein